MKYNILHTADWQLWHKHRYTRLVLGKHWDELCEAQFRVLESTFVPFLVRNKVTHFVIAGDIFEHYNPIEPVRDRFVNLMLDITNHVQQVHILLGNHDMHKGQEALESIKTMLAVSDRVVGIESDEFEIYSGVWVGHYGVTGFMANGAYIEPENRCVQYNDIKKRRLTMLGHYHKNQHKGSVYYSGSPYQCDFGEEGETKYFNTYVLTGNKITAKRHQMYGVRFMTIDANKLKKIDEHEDQYQYRIFRVRQKCPPEKEKHIRRVLLENKSRVISRYDDVLDVLIDLRIDRGTSTEQIQSQKGKIDYMRAIDEVDVDKRFKKYIRKKFEEVAV